MWLRVWMSTVEEDLVRMSIWWDDEMAVIFSSSLVVDIPCSEICNLLLIYTILTSDSWKGSIVWLPHVN